MPSPYQALRASGAPLDSHESDLYVKDTPEVRKIIAANPQSWSFSRFRHQVTKEMWLDLPFAFDPWWEKHGVSRT